MTVDVATPIFLTVLVFVVPALAWMSRKVLDDEAITIPRSAFYIEAIVLQIALLALAVWMMYERDIAIPLGGDVTFFAVGLMLGALIFALAVMFAGWRLTSDSRRNRLLKIAPRTPQERSLWIVVSICAAMCEEIIFRGALFELFRGVAGGSWWPAAIAAAIVFGLAHLAQGVTSALLVMIFGLALQALVAATGGLLVVIILHFLYDLVVGLVVGRIPEPESPINGNL